MKRRIWIVLTLLLVSCQTTLSTEDTSASSQTTSSTSTMTTWTSMSSIGSEEVSLDAYPTIAYYHEILSQRNKLNQPILEYLVYFYSPTCSACIRLKPEVVRLFETLQEQGVIVYAINVWELKEQNDGDMEVFFESIGRTFLAVPCLVGVVDGTFHSFSLGSASVLEELNRWIDSHPET